MQSGGSFNLVKGEGVLQSSCNYTDMSTNVLACHSKVAIQVLMPPSLNINDAMHTINQDNRITLKLIEWPKGMLRT